MEKQILEGIQAIMCGGIAIAIPFVINVARAIKKKAIEEMGQKRFEQAEKFAFLVVKTIEQSFPDLTNEEKYIKAIEFIKGKFGKEVFTEYELKVLIESAVDDLKNVISKNQKLPLSTVNAMKIGKQ